jgi:hypothetical protein
VKNQFLRINIRPILKEEEQRWVELMKEHHYLGFNGNLGERINYVAKLNGKWLALLSWSSAALHLESRDKWIGWTKEKKDARLIFIANNCRFLILPEIKIKNLASHILGKNLRRLSSDWNVKYGHPIFMVETFVEKDKYKGTCYKADNWLFIGVTKGFQKNHKNYFYHGKIKLVFLKPLLKNAREILGSSFTHPIFLPERLRGRVIMDVNKINVFGKNGLIEFCSDIQDTRAKRGVRHKFIGLMSVCILATLSGTKGYKGIYTWGKSLGKDMLWNLKLRNAPGESTIRRFILSLNASEVDEKLTQWLLNHESLNGIALAIDGKTLRGSRDGKIKPLQLLSVVSHESAIIFAQEEVNSKTNEIPVVQKLLTKLDIKGAVITADALHSQDKTAAIIARNKKADYVFTIKDNRSSIKKEIQKSLSDSDFSPSAF